MDYIKTIQDKINTIISIIGIKENELQQTPNSRALQLTTESYKNQLEQLQNELRIAKAKREKEFVEIRLRGRNTDGSISLEALGQLSRGFSDMLIYASTSIQFGISRKPKREQIKEVSNTINLKLVGLAPGSTKLYITANTSPDLFGNSLSEKSLENSFNLFQSKTPEKLIESAAFLGKKSIDGVKTFISAINKSDFEVSINWSSPEDKNYNWEGGKHELTTLINSLNKITEPEPELLTVSGELITISLKGNFEIKEDRTDVLYKGKYPNDLVEKMKQLHIGMKCKAEIEKKIFINQATEKESVYYTLLTINP